MASPESEPILVISYGEGGDEGPDRRHHLSNPNEQHAFNVKNLAQRVIGENHPWYSIRIRETGDAGFRLRAEIQNLVATLFGFPRNRR